MTVEVLQGFILELEDKPGALHNVTMGLAVAGVNIQGIGGATVNGSGVIGLVTENSLETRSVMKELALSVRPVEYLCVRTEDQPGALDRYLTLLAREGLNVISLFPLVSREPTIAMACDDAVRAREVLRKVMS